MEYLLKPSTPLMLKISAPTPLLSNKFLPAPKIIPKSLINICKSISRNAQIHKKCTKLSTHTIEFETEEGYHFTEEYVEQNEDPPPPLGILQRQRRRYRKQYAGEVKGITEEMRFVTMKLRNGKKGKSKSNPAGAGAASHAEELGINGGSWEPSMEGFLKYLVDSKLVFDTIEHIVDESSDVSYVYFRKTGLERSDGLSKDLESLRVQGNVIPQPSNPGIMYCRYLKELAEKSRPLFLCHFYNFFFSHIAGGQVIGKQVSNRLLEGRELEFYRWEGDAEELLRAVREKLNALGEHWSRDEKNKCLMETTKTFRFLGQIVRLIIL